MILEPSSDHYRIDTKEHNVLFYSSEFCRRIETWF